jgi:hypothetical protein
MSGWLVGPIALAGVVVLERLGHKLTGSRAKGWIGSYLILGLVALAVGPQISTSGIFDWRVLVGVALALGGYRVGRLILGDRPDRPPSESRNLELVALAGVVAPVEELLWGAVVGPELGIPATAALFAVKHPLVDGRWRRVLGLLLFWIGLSLVRAYSWPLALALHIGANAGGVLIGHRQNLDQF